MAKDGNKIYWKDLIWLVITITAISTSVSLGALTIHSKTPHEGAVTQREMDIFSENTSNSFDSMEEKINRILTKLDK